ncbi:MAG: hypothetical protein WD407_12310, partial [Rhodospirillales bacterium]
MSIQDSINDGVRKGRLCWLQPRVDGEEIKRHMLMGESVAPLILGPWEDQEWKNRCFRLRNDLEDFIHGNPITIARNPQKARNAFMSQLNPPADSAWDIRARDPRPGIRILGRFAE